MMFINSRICTDLPDYRKKMEDAQKLEDMVLLCGEIHNVEEYYDTLNGILDGIFELKLQEFGLISVDYDNVDSLREDIEDNEEVPDMDKEFLPVLFEKKKAIYKIWYDLSMTLSDATKRLCEMK
jgi:hypothetical protein